ncbi:Hypothetical predicted protein [Scomber scombrus]|uniref:Interleukin-31 n=1 Tax=Scomber scombrus TaxID=13677 RepID=A0AAV1P595_SCOSC
MVTSLHVTAVVLLFLCLPIAQAACRSKRSSVLNESRQELLDETTRAVRNLTTSREIPETSSCLPLNTTELVGPERQPLTAYQLSSFRCLMLKVSKLNLQLKDDLKLISQMMWDMENVIGGSKAKQDCNIPPSEQDMCSYEYAKRLLQLLEQQLSKAEF